MGRPLTPTSILDASGAFKRHPERKNKNEPIVTNPFPDSPPLFLSDQEKACWNEVVSLAPAGVLTASDPLIVEVIARLLAEYRELGPEMLITKVTRLCQEMAKIGLTPSGRAGLSVEKPKEANKFL